jgi:hypothetical protein
MSRHPLDRRRGDYGYNIRAVCRCGHTAYWHGQPGGAPDGSGECDHCPCARFAEAAQGIPLDAFGPVAVRGLGDQQDGLATAETEEYR